MVFSKQPLSCVEPLISSVRQASSLCNIFAFFLISSLIFPVFLSRTSVSSWPLNHHTTYVQSQVYIPPLSILTVLVFAIYNPLFTIQLVRKKRSQQYQEAFTKPTSGHWKSVINKFYSMTMYRFRRFLYAIFASLSVQSALREKTLAYEKNVINTSISF